MKKEINLGGVLYLVNKAGKNGFPFRIRLQKTILLGKIEFGFPFEFNYSSHFYGPYSSELQKFTDDLITNSILNEETRELIENHYGYYYTLTEKGSDILSKINLSKPDKEKLDKLWEKYSGFNTSNLVKKAKELSGIKSIDE